MTDLLVTFRGVPLIPPIECSDPNSWIAERIYEMGANDARAALAQPEQQGPMLEADDISPAAQAVYDAFWNGILYNDDITDSNIAAALRAAADQVVPEPPMIVEGGRTYEEAWTATVYDDIRRRFLAIAAELEG